MEFRVENPQGMHVFKQMGEIAVELRMESGARYYTIDIYTGMFS
jgi:hypothetical protein